MLAEIYGWFTESIEVGQFRLSKSRYYQVAAGRRCNAPAEAGAWSDTVTPSIHCSQR
jgi:hypothetical protein